MSDSNEDDVEDDGSSVSDLSNENNDPELKKKTKRSRSTI